MRPCLHQVDFSTVFTRDVNGEEFLNVRLFPCRMLSEFGHPISLMPMPRNNKENHSDDDTSVVIDGSQLRGKIVEFTDQQGNRRKFKFLRELGCKTAGVFRVREVRPKGTQPAQSGANLQKRMVMKILVLEMAKGFMIAYKFVFTRKLQKQLLDFIRDGGMRDWLRRISEQIDESMVPGEIIEKLRCLPPSRYEILDVLLSPHHGLEKSVHNKCVEAKIIDDWELLDFGKLVKAWVTVCLLNPIHEEAIDRCVSPYVSKEKPAMPRCESMLSQDEWPPIPGARIYNCRLIEDVPGTSFSGLVSRICKHNWERKLLRDVDKRRLPSSRAEIANLANAAVELAYQLDKSGLIQADHITNIRVVDDRQTGGISHLVCIDGGWIYAIAGHTTATPLLLGETEAIIARYSGSSEVLTDFPISLMSS